MLGINPLMMSAGGGIRMKKLIRKLAAMTATITARLRSKNCVLPFQNMK